MVIGVAIAGIVLAGAVPAAALGQGPDLSGRWTYDAAQSDNPRDQMRGGDSTGRASRGRGGAPGGGGSGGSWGGHGGMEGGGGWGGGMNDLSRERMRQTLRLALVPPHALSIDQTDSTVTLVVDSADALTLSIDGHKVKQKVDGGGDIEDRARWQGDNLIVDRSVSGGGKIVEDYLRSQDGKQLYVIVRFTGMRGRSIEFRRVYDSVPADRPS
jgi:hypothetical protein